MVFFSQDIIYFLFNLCWTVAILPATSLDAKDLVATTSAFRFVFSVSLKRGWVAYLCLLFNFVHNARLAAMQDQDAIHESHYEVHHVPALHVTVGSYVVVLVGVVFARCLLNEHTSLKNALQRRTVELGVISTLLNASYDAVVEVDDSWRLMGDTSQLSTMLKLANSKSLIAGQSLLDFFAKEDQTRISQQVEASISMTDSTVAMALNADILDSDQNQVGFVFSVWRGSV